MSKHLDILRKHHENGNHNVNLIDVHKASLSLNDRIAQHVSGIVGTMWFCYGLAAVMTLWALLQQKILPGLHIVAFDPYPFAFLFFVLGGIMQSLLMPLIMVAQNMSAAHTELRAESDHHINQENFDRLERIEQQQLVMLTRLEKRIYTKKVKE